MKKVIVGLATIGCLVSGAFAINQPYKIVEKNFINGEMVMSSVLVSIPEALDENDINIEFINGEKVKEVKINKTLKSMENYHLVGGYKKISKNRLYLNRDINKEVPKDSIKSTNEKEIFLDRGFVN